MSVCACMFIDMSFLSTRLPSRAETGEKPERVYVKPHDENVCIYQIRVASLCMASFS